MATTSSKAPAKTPAKTANPVAAKPAPARKPSKPAVKKPTPTPVKVKPVASKTIAVKKTASPKPEKPIKPKKPKMVRDSFTIPKAEYTVLDDLKLRAIKLARPIKKGELLRAGIKALAAMPDAAFLSALNAVPTLKTGRPISKGD